MFNFLVEKFLGEVEFAGDYIIKKVDDIRIVFACNKTVFRLFKFILLCNSIKELPNNIKCAVREYGGLIRLDEFTDISLIEITDVKDFASLKRVLAFYRPEDRAIFIRWNMNKKLFVSSLYHEIGHLIDNKLNDGKEISFRSIEDKCLHEIAVKEGDYYGFDSYSMSNIKEYFAESFSRFYLIKNFNKKCPETHKTILNYISEI